MEWFEGVAGAGLFEWSVEKYLSAAGSEAMAGQGGGAECFAGFPDNERDKKQGGERVGPGLAPESIDEQSCEGDPGEVAAECRFNSVGFQCGTGGQNGKFSFFVCEPGHDECSKEQEHNSHKAGMGFTMAEQGKNGDDGDVDSEGDEQRARDARGEPFGKRGTRF